MRLKKIWPICSKAYVSYSVHSKIQKKNPSLLGKMKDTILYENDLISPINETWDAEKESE